SIYDHVVRTNPAVSLLIVGDGPYREEYERTVKGRGWTNVHFIGYVQADQLHKYFAIADAFIFHTLYDPYGLVLAEAMASEVLVLSSIHAVSTHDLVEDGVTGFRIDPFDTEASARTVSTMSLMTPSERQSMTTNALARVQDSDVQHA